MAPQKTFQNPDKSIFTLSEAIDWRQEMAEHQKTVVFTNGCFDILHRGHAEYLYRARCCGDALIVALNSDKSIKSLKGKDRPIIDEYNRAYMMASLKFVDAVIIFNTTRCTKLIKQIKPDIYIKGGDYNVDTMDTSEKNALLDVGSVIKFIPFIDGFSTTTLLEKITNNA